MFENPLRNLRWMKLILCIHFYGISLYINCDFYSGWLRTLVAMATNSSHRLLMGKVEIDSFCRLIGDITLVAMTTSIFIKVKIDNFFCLNGDIWNLFLQKCLLSSSKYFIWLLSKSLNLIGKG